MQSPSAPGAAATPLTLVLTGRRRKNRIAVLIGGQPVLLTGSQFDLIIDLIIESGKASQGYVSIPPRDVCRLRHAIGDAVGDDAGSALIEHCCGEEYRLTVSARSQVGVTPCFHELVPIRLVTQEQADAIRRLCVATDWNSFGIGLE